MFMISKEITEYFLKQDDIHGYFRALPPRIGYEVFCYLSDDLLFFTTDKYSDIATTAKRFLSKLCQNFPDLHSKQKYDKELLERAKVFTNFPEKPDDQEVENYYLCCKTQIDFLRNEGKLNINVPYTLKNNMSYEENLLMYAIRTQRHRLVKMLLESDGVSVRELNQEGENALRVALTTRCDCRGDHYELIKMLLNADKTAIDHYGDAGHRVLEAAIENYCADEIIMLLLSAGAYSRDDPSTLVLSAYQHNVSTFVFKLLCQKILTSQDKQDDALFFLVNSIGEDCKNIATYVPILLNVGANINAVDKHKNTPLYGLVKRSIGHDAIPVLLRHGARTDLTDAEGNNYLHLVIKNLYSYCHVPNRQDSELSLFILLSCNQRCIKNKNKYGETLLHIFFRNQTNCYNGDNWLKKNNNWLEKVKNIQMMLEFDLDINEQDIEGMTPLMLEISQPFPVPNPNIVKLLLEKGADVNAVNNDGDTALIMAINKSIVNIGAVIHQETIEVPNLTIENMRKEWLSIVTLLLDAGAERETVNKDGLSAFNIAVSGGTVELVKLINRKDDFKSDNRFDDNFFVPNGYGG
jgi:ankyrin repeat protein